MIRLGVLIQKCGEAQAAAGKVIRWGSEAFNPELPSEKQETNREELLRKLRSLKDAIADAEFELTAKGVSKDLKFGGR